jgi:voltage-gated potassium channel
VMLESVSWIGEDYAEPLYQLEWGITALFSLEYIARLLVVKKPWRYVSSFFGIIDLLSILPMYISFFFVGTTSLIALRALRLLRVFRILKLSRYIGESNFLMAALWASRAKIGVFLFAVIILCIIFGTIMYLVEGEVNGFTSIPRGIYWCIVTLTTVGYGDIAPVTPLGRFIASIIMIIGYGIIAVPTGIVTSEMTQQHQNPDTNTQACPNCITETHLDDAIYCHNCGHKLNEDF